MYKKRNKNTKWAIEESKTNLNSAKNRTVLLSKVAKKNHICDIRNGKSNIFEINVNLCEMALERLQNSIGKVAAKKIIHCAHTQSYLERKKSLPVIRKFCVKNDECPAKS